MGCPLFDSQDSTYTQNCQVHISESAAYAFICKKKKREKKKQIKKHKVCFFVIHYYICLFNKPKQTNKRMHKNYDQIHLDIVESSCIIFSVFSVTKCTILDHLILILTACKYIYNIKESYLVYNTMLSIDDFFLPTVDHT